MSFVERAPQDPIFWRWHNFVDTVRQNRIGLTPPTVEDQTPFPVFYWITELPSIEVNFTEPVTGVTAADMLVNGSPATDVTGSGAGPYVFTGYTIPAFGQVVTVIILPGAIIAPRTGEGFQGTSWKYDLIDPKGDDDRDGVSNFIEANISRTDPGSADTD